jgi:hypothetical protein
MSFQARFLRQAAKGGEISPGKLIAKKNTKDIIKRERMIIMAKKLGYIVTDYSGSDAGDIGVVGTTVTVNKAQVTDWTLNSNGDSKVHSFFDTSNNLRVVVDQYNFSTGASPGLRIYNPVTTTWTAVTTARNWSGIVNLYGVVKLGNYLYAIDYDGANVVKISLAGATPYTVAGTYHFASGISGYEDHGVAIAAVGDYVYALFITSDSSASNYQNSTVVKLDVSGTNPTNVGQASVGKNAFTLEYYDGKFYVACIGGMQQAGSYNAASQLNVVNISTMGVTTPFTASATIPGDFRDIVFSNSGDAYILTGYYDSSYTNLIGKLYKTTAANINASPSVIGTAVDTFTEAGYFWATLYEDVSGGSTDYFWFARGNPIKIYQPVPTTSPATAFATKTPADLGNSPRNVSINWITPFWEPSSPLARKGAPRSFAAHAKLAADAKKAALELEDKK